MTSDFVVGTSRTLVFSETTIMVVSSFSGTRGWLAFVSFISSTSPCKTHPETRNLGSHTRIQVSRASSHSTTSPLVKGPKEWDFFFGSTETRQVSETTSRLVRASAGKGFSGERSCRSGLVFCGGALKAEQPKTRRGVQVNRRHQEKSTRRGCLKLQPRATIHCVYREQHRKERKRTSRPDCFHRCSSQQGDLKHSVQPSTTACQRKAPP
jgi:hypothetical protein